MVKLNLKKMSVDLSPVVSYWDGRPRINEEYDWEPIPVDSRLDLVMGDIRIPEVVSKGLPTPFRMVAVGTWDQCVVEIECVPNLCDYSCSEWLERFGNEYSFEGRECSIDIRPISVTHPNFGPTQIRFEIEDLDGVVIVEAWIEVKINGKATILVAQLPLEAFVVDGHLTSVAITGLSRNGWEADPLDVQRVKEECDRWNATQWVPLTGTYVESDLEFGDDDRRSTISTSHSHTWWQDPTGHFQGPCKHRKSQWGVYADKPQHRNPEKEIHDLFPSSHWSSQWLPTLMTQWEKSFG